MCARIVERDARDVSAMQTLDRLPDVLRILAARNAEELNVSGLANALDIPATTLSRQLDLLETLYLVHRVPAWSTNLSKGVVARPKALLLDSGPAARLINGTAEGLAPGVNDWEGRERRRSARMLIVEISTILNERLPQEVRDAHPEVPWRQIAAMRNWATHVDDRVDDTIVWDALVHDVPAVMAALGIRAR